MHHVFWIYDFSRAWVTEAGKKILLRIFIVLLQLFQGESAQSCSQRKITKFFKSKQTTQE